MSLRPSELALVISELAGQLMGSVIQKVWAPSPHRLLLALRQVGRTTLLFMCTEPAISRVSVVTARSADSELSGSALQRVFRQELVGGRVSELIRPTGLHVLIRIERDEKTRWISAVLGGGARIRIERTPALEKSDSTADSLPSRLIPNEGTFPLATAAERLFAASEKDVDLASLRRRARLPLQRELKRLDKTLAKVQVESERHEAAEQHRRFGELLRHHAGEVPRGAGDLTLSDYTEQGVKEVTVPLVPGLSKRAQIERHLHQYRRLQRGSELARERWQTLQAQKQTLEDRLQSVATMDLAELRRGPALTPIPSVARRMTERNPYNVYIGANGQAIWVGRGGGHNDSLTFRYARPEHWWIHARGVAGAHVVVPLGKGVELSTEILLDAAHLALHHSGQKGEAQGEVSYTRVKYVRKVKGGAKGEVTYSQDKTFWLRIEEERLARLLATRSRAGDEGARGG